jgi:DNA-binding response OmpR family regulator
VFSIVVLSNRDELARSIRAALAPAEYTLRTLPHGADAVDELAQNPPDLIIFDHGDGSHLDEWRGIGRERPLGEHSGLLALIAAEQGSLLEQRPAADDFAIWPAAAAELLLRVRGILRRRTNVDSENLLRCGELTIDLGNYKVTLGGRPVELTFKEYELLRFLASNRDRVFTREALLNRVWGYDYFGGARTVDVHIRRLRSKIEDRGHSFIETIRNVGYRFHEG